MGSIKWYKRDPDAALGGMMGLSLEERGAYNTVLDLIYSRDDTLVDDDRFICGWLQCDLRVWRRIKAKLIGLEKITVQDGLVRNFRATSEIDAALGRVASVSELNRIKGIKSGIARRKNNGLVEPAVEPNSNTPRLTPRLREEDICPKAETGFADAPIEIREPEKVPSKKRREYPGDFEAFWQAYPTDPGMSKAEAAKHWAKLNAADRLAAVSGIPGFKLWASRQGADYRTVHACRYLSQRRFDGFVNGTHVDYSKHLDIGRRRKFWDIAKVGPIPGQAGCRVPANLLQPGDGDGWTDIRRDQAA